MIASDWCLLIDNKFSAYLSTLNEPTTNAYWSGGVYSKIRNYTSAEKGKIAENFLKNLFLDNYIRTSKATVNDYDLLVDSVKIEVKFSTARNGDDYNFMFQQIRDDDYDQIFFFGVNRDSLFLGYAEKQEAIEVLQSNKKYLQHYGQRTKGVDSLYWIYGDIRSETWVKTFNISDWICKYNIKTFAHF